ncbi:MAG: hypothetical protein K2Y27_09200 [Xanthobacteraceae bacterium]|nr:hypothetical protein [Xanthobacteraceae bacterium]
MSIRDLIIAHEGTALWRFEPPKVPIKRRLYLTGNGRKHLTDPNSATNVLKLRGHIQNALVHWVSGGRVRGDELGKARFLKRLCPPPPEIWEVRVTDPTPQVRLLGRVVEPDTLILDRFHTRGYLGDKGDPGWKEAMEGCHSTFEKLFPGEPIFQRATIHEYVTENCDDFRI